MISPILQLLPFTTSAVTRLAEFRHLVDEDEGLLVRQAHQVRQLLIQISLQKFKQFLNHVDDFDASLFSRSAKDSLLQMRRILCFEVSFSPPAHSSPKLKPLLVPLSVIKKSDNKDFCCLLTAYRLVDVIASLTQAPLSPAAVFPQKPFKRASPLAVCRVVVPSSTLTNHCISIFGNLKTGLMFWIVFKQQPSR